MKGTRKILSLLLCLAIVLSSVNTVSADPGDVFTKVTDASELTAGDKIIIVADDADYAISTNQKLSSRGASAVTKNGDKVTAAADTQILTLAAGAVEGTFAFYTGSGYLYAASSDKNQLKTTATLDENASWKITIENGVTSIAAQGSNTRNTMQFNPNDGAPLFTCCDGIKMGSLSIYKHAEAGQGSEEVPAVPREVTIPEAMELAGEDNGVKYLVRGTVTEVTNGTWGNLYIEDAQGNSLYIHGVYSMDGTTRYDGLETKPMASDEVLLLGTLTTYNGNARMVDGWLQELVVGEHETEETPDTPKPDDPTNPDASKNPQTPDDGIISIEEAIAIGAAKENSTYTQEKYAVTGVIVEITSQTWGNLCIADTDGNRLYIFGLYSADGSVRFDALQTKPVVGQTITVLGVLGQYNGRPQMKNAWLQACVSAEDDPITLAVCAMLLSGAATGLATGKYSK